MRSCAPHRGLVGIYAGASKRVIAVIIALGAGVLVSSVGFELIDKSYKEGGDAASLGLLAGAVTFFLADRAVSSRVGEDRKNSGEK